MNYINEPSYLEKFLLTRHGGISKLTNSFNSINSKFCPNCNSVLFKDEKGILQCNNIICVDEKHFENINKLRKL